MRCTHFDTEYGMWSGPGAQVFEDLERALDISGYYCDRFSFLFFFFSFFFFLNLNY